MIYFNKTQTEIEQALTRTLAINLSSEQWVALKMYAFRWL